MTNSKRSAALLGSTLIAMTRSESKLIDPHLCEHQIAPVVYLSGTLLFVAGPSIVRVNSRWTSGWPMLVTLMRWFAILGGLFGCSLRGFTTKGAPDRAPGRSNLLLHPTRGARG
jgi:hypothetical protein